MSDSDIEIHDSSSVLENLHEALDDKEGESIIISILCSKSNSDLQKLKKDYENKYNENLEEKLNKKLKSKLKDLIQALLQDPIEYDANEIFKAVDGLGTDDDALIEIISSRSQDHLKDVSKKYFETRKVTMENDIKNDTSQAYGRLITQMSKGERSENPYPNINDIKKICSELKGEKNKKLDKDIFVKYFSQCSNSELIMIYKIFEKENGKNLLDFINEKFGADSRNLYKAIFSYLANPIKYFTERIHTWKDKIVIRNIVSQRDNLKEIKEEYKKLYDKNLEDDIKEKTKDGFQKALLNLVSN
jgi:annexin A7/11